MSWLYSFGLVSRLELDCACCLLLSLNRGSWEDVGSVPWFNHRHHQRTDSILPMAWVSNLKLKLQAISSKVRVCRQCYRWRTYIPVLPAFGSRDAESKTQKTQWMAHRLISVNSPIRARCLLCSLEFFPVRIPFIWSQRKVNKLAALYGKLHIIKRRGWSVCSVNLV